MHENSTMAASPSGSNAESWSMRPHISINVNNIEKSTEFYSVLFGAQPAKRRADYAKFVSNDPPMNVSLLELESSTRRDGHFGIQVKSTKVVEAFKSRLETSGLSVKAQEKEVACCYSVQTKVWAEDPDGNHWEVFVVTEQAPDAACSSDCDCICYDPKTGGCTWG